VSLDNAFALIEGHPEPSQPVKDAPPATRLISGSSAGQKREPAASGYIAS